MKRIQLMLSKQIERNPKAQGVLHLSAFQRRQIIWGALGVFAICCKWIGSQHPIWIETYYSRGIFKAIRYGIDYTLAWSPIPLMYLLIPLLLFFLLRSLLRWLQRSRTSGQRVTDVLFALIGWLGGTLFFFLFLWGFNYDRVPLENQLSITPHPLRLSELQKELEEETARIIALRPQIPGITDSTEFTEAFLPSNLEDHARTNLTTWLEENGFPTPGRVRGRILEPKGIFLRFSTAGLYFPFTGEGHIDGGLHPVQWPYVLTHELAHGYGFGDEGSCNFLAYVASIRDESPAMAYAGHLNYWRTLAIQYRQYEPDAYLALRENLPNGVQLDLDGINEAMQRYPDLIPHLQYRMYDAYLKTQGIEEGMLNYNRVVMLVRAWRDALKS